jgi:Arc/MetJ-type ribon-helix-helix transcriptional regulator
MSYQFPPDIESLVQQHLASGHFDTPDEVLRTALCQLTMDEEDLRAIQESLDRLDNGEEGIPLADAFQQLRRQYDIPADA